MASQRSDGDTHTHMYLFKIQTEGITLCTYVQHGYKEFVMLVVSTLIQSEKCNENLFECRIECRISAK